jgi:hypothetical protein
MRETLLWIAEASFYFAILVCAALVGAGYAVISL